MENSALQTRPDERAALGLRRLYESRGFRRVRPGKFEEHALYIENKNFLESERVISFMDMNGKLLALKPDVTLSVVKNIPAGELPVCQKLYYMDDVYRVSRENREYRVSSQIGIELVGPDDPFSGIEVIELALLSLEAVSPRYVLDISHLGFVSGLLAGLELPHTVEKQALAAIHSRSSHELSALLGAAGVPDERISRVLELSALHGDLASVLPTAGGLVINDETKAAFDELSAVAAALGGGTAGRLNLDFSVVNDLDYYNGLIFHGYVEGMPYAILSGGRYDKLMRRMGKASCAAGFAVTLDGLNTYLREARGYDFDIVVAYGENCDKAALLGAARRLGADGSRVRLERAASDLSAADFTWKKLMRFEGDKLLEEVEQC